MQAKVDPEMMTTTTIKASSVSTPSSHFSAAKAVGSRHDGVSSSAYAKSTL